MRKNILVTNFDFVLQEHFENKYGISINFRHTLDGDFALSLSGARARVDEADKELVDLSNFKLI